MEREITVSIDKVYKEVAQITAYNGGKRSEEPQAYDRISVVDDDKEELDNMLEECRKELCYAMRHVIKSETLNGVTYKMKVVLPWNFKDVMLEVVRGAIEQFFVHGIVSRWYVYTNKGEEESESARASALLGVIVESLFMRERPERP